MLTGLSVGKAVMVSIQAHSLFIITASSVFHCAFQVLYKMLYSILKESERAIVSKLNNKRFPVHCGLRGYTVILLVDMPTFCFQTPSWLCKQKAYFSENNNNNNNSKTHFQS